MKELSGQASESETQSRISVQYANKQNCNGKEESKNGSGEHHQSNSKKRVRLTPTSEVDKCFKDGVREQSNTAETNADWGFVQSLMADVNKMSCKSKRRFKRSVLELIDNILMEQEDQETRERKHVAPSHQDDFQSNSTLQDEVSQDERLSSQPDEILVFVNSILSQLKTLPKSISNSLVKKIVNLIDSRTSTSGFCDKNPIEEVFVKCEVDVEESVVAVKDRMLE